MRQLIAVALFCAGLFCIAQAQVPMTGAGLGAPGGATTSFQGSGDTVSGAIVYASCARAYNAAYALATGNGCDVKRTSDSTSCTIKFATTGFTDLTTTYCGGQNAAAFCNATTCNVTKAYDQSGANDCGSGRCDFTGTTAATLTFSALNGLPCFTFAGGAGLLSPTTNNAHSQPISGSAVAERTGATSSFGDILGTTSGSVQALLFSSVAANFATYAGNVAGPASATDNAYHAFNTVVNGTSSSIIVVDATALTGQNAGTQTIAANDGYILGNGNNALTGNVCEARLDPIAYNSTQYGNLNTNQHSASNGYNF